MEEMTIRQVVEAWKKTSRLGPRRVRDALIMLRLMGRVPNFTPGREDYDRRLVILKDDDVLAPLFRRTLVGAALFERVEVEQLIGSSITGSGAIKRLSRHGLVLTALTETTVTLRGTSSDLARLINTTRFADRPLRRRVDQLIRIALDRNQRPRRITESARMKVALIFDSFAVDAEQMLDGTVYASPVSRWTVAAQEAAFDARTANHELRLVGA